MLLAQFYPMTNFEQNYILNALKSAGTNLVFENPLIWFFKSPLPII